MKDIKTKKIYELHELKVFELSSDGATWAPTCCLSGQDWDKKSWPNSPEQLGKSVRGKLIFASSSWGCAEVPSKYTSEYPNCSHGARKQPAAEDSGHIGQLPGVTGSTAPGYKKIITKTLKRVIKIIDCDTPMEILLTKWVSWMTSSHPEHTMTVLFRTRPISTWAMLFLWNSVSSMIKVSPTSVCRDKTLLSEQSADLKHSAHVAPAAVSY